MAPFSKSGDNTVETIDFKSEKKPDVELEKYQLEKYQLEKYQLEKYQLEKYQLEKYQRQLEIYAYLFEERTGQTVSKLHLYYTGEKDGIPYISFDKSQQSIDQTINGFDNVVEKIEKNDFRLSVEPGKKCNDCDMRFYCRNKK